MRNEKENRDNDVRLSLPSVVCRGHMCYLRYLCLLAHSGVQHILCCVFALFFFVLCTICCQFLWIVHFFITSSVFSNVYLQDKKDFCKSMGNTKEWIRRTERNWSREKERNIFVLRTKWKNIFFNIVISLSYICCHNAL